MRALLAVMVLAASSQACTSAGSAPPPARDEGAVPRPVLILRHGAGPHAKTGASSERGGAILALVSLPHPELTTLGHMLDDLALDVAIAKNPMAVDLRDDAPPPAGVLMASLEANAPRLSAARSLAAGVWSSSDGDLSVELSATCNAPVGARCITLWPRPGENDAEAARARFFAWPVTHAAVLRATPGGVQALARALRVASDETKGHDDPIALVLTRTLDDETRATLAEVRRAADDTRAELQGTKEGLAAMGSLVDELSRGDEGALALLPIGPDEVMIVPRLHSLADPSTFYRVIAARLATSGLPATWVQAPR